MRETTLSTVEIRPLTSDYADAALKVLARAFLDEPMMNFLKIPLEDLARFFEPRVRATVKDGLSLVLLEDGKCASAMLNDDLSENYEGMDIPNSMRPVFEFLDQIHERCGETEVQRRGRKYLHFFCGATIPEARNKGYLGRLTAAGYEMARTRGFEHVLVEATSPHTRSLCKRQGFEVVRSVPNSEFPAFRTMQAQVDIMRLAL